MPKVSIVVPVYNMQKYLATCIKSLKAQTLSDIEIILVDDGSSDNSPALCDARGKEVLRKQRETISAMWMRMIIFCPICMNGCIQEPAKQGQISYAAD